MEIKRTKEIYVETKRRFVVLHQPDGMAERQICPTCGELLLAVEAAATLLGISHRTVYQTVEAGAAHFAETADGAILVCPSSLAEIFDTEIKLLPEAEQTNLDAASRAE